MSHPTYQDTEEYQNRLSKLQELEKLGVSPYPHHFSAQHTAGNLQKEYAGQEIGGSADAEEGKTPLVSVSGRLVLFRAMGKNAFGQILDRGEKIQVMFNKQKTQVSDYTQEGNNAPTPIKIIEKRFDLGDLLGVKGHLFRTQKGELTIFVTEVQLLCKTLLPLPDKHSGLADKETRYRKRWLDLISSADVYKTFSLRSQIIRFIRRFFEDQDFMEVETPVLQNIYGGAEASPFLTELHALDHQQMYLRISLEISLKKLLIGGFPRVFEIGKIFRNEGIDRTHNPEFTMLEAYAANWDYNDLMVLVENLFEKIALDLFGKTEISFGEHVIDVKAPWKRMTMEESLASYGKVDTSSLSTEELKAKLLSCSDLEKKDVEKLPRGLVIQNLFEELVEEHLIQPHHITDHPIETTPLCKPHREKEKNEQGIVERFESFIFATEICNAYSELNNPILQRELFEKQAEGRSKEEKHPVDEEFLEAICQGMPPAGGLGIGIDRLVMLFSNHSSIRDVLFFPLMKRLTKDVESDSP